MSRTPLIELAVIIETTPLCQYVVTTSGRFVWIEKKYSVSNAIVGDVIQIVLRQARWVRRWCGEVASKPN